MNYLSTRGGSFTANDRAAGFLDILLEGLAPDGDYRVVPAVSDGGDIHPKPSPTGVIR